MAVEKAVAVVMQESGRRALFDASQRLGANYREKAGLIKSSESVPGLCAHLIKLLWEQGKLLSFFVLAIIYTILEAKEWPAGEEKSQGLI